MEKTKKNDAIENLNILEEPTFIYEKENIEVQKNTPEQDILLQKLLKIGLEQSKMKMGRPHSEVWPEMQARLKVI